MSKSKKQPNPTPPNYHELGGRLYSNIIIVQDHLERMASEEFERSVAVSLALRSLVSMLKHAGHEWEIGVGSHETLQQMRKAVR